ncbi:alpha/beta hydrolase [Actinoplanes sp. NPDC026619]|uniref:alpha/beta fold hydrolase n=1 Tax=Actinoplanes sp. NPDC026619 TaxID=3155798 RepID=UPI00340DD65B
MSSHGPTDADVTTTDGRTLRYQEAGDLHGHPVFLLHGMPGSRIGPRPRPGLLSRLGIRLISYDRPGYGGSERHARRTVADCATDVTRIADHLGLDGFAVAGRSGGGPHALACAALLPDRVNRAAVLVSFAPDEAGLDWYAGMNAANARDFSLAQADEEQLVETLRQQADRVRRRPMSLLESLRDQVSVHDQRVVADATIERLLLESYAEATRPGPYGWIDDALALRRPWGFDLTAISQRVLLWHGAEDNVVPASHARWLAQRIPSAELTVQSGSAHFGAMEILPSILSWLTQDPEARAAG